jgi:RIO-like serine/threonine protein kinase
MARILAQSNVSKVWLEDGFVYKEQPKFLTDNEIWCLKRFALVGFVPKAEQVALEVIKMEYVKPMPITNFGLVKMDANVFIHNLEKYGIRHGDLTDKNMLIRNNRLYVIDWSESRLACDPRTDKRPEGDKFWMTKTLERLSKKN